VTDNNQPNRGISEIDLLQQILRELQETNRLLDSFIDAVPDRSTCSWSSCSQAMEDLQLLRDTIRLLSKRAGSGSELPYRVTTIGVSPSRTWGVSPSRTWSGTKISSQSSSIG